jgi:hypothetical protein
LDTRKPPLANGNSGSTSDLYRRLSGFRAGCPESGGQSGASRPIPASDGAGMTAPKRTSTSCHSRGRSLSWGRAEHPARRAEQQEAGRKARLPLLRSQVPVLFQIKFPARPRTHYSPDLAAVDRTLVGGCQAAFHLLQYLICLGSRTVQRRPILVVDH